MSDKYGAMPINLGVIDPEFTEYMTYQYLPIFIREIGNDDDTMWDYELPQNLWFAENLINMCVEAEYKAGNEWDYIYLTAKRGFATPGNPLNRPGWHADGFGTTDINYVWVDKYPTLFALGEFGDISDDHIESVNQFTREIDERGYGPYKGGMWTPGAAQALAGQGAIALVEYPDKTLLRLDDTVIHAAPEVPKPGGERSFLKVSFSNDKYNLLGNAHNYLLDYHWEMYARDAVRNDPAKAGKDSA